MTDEKVYEEIKEYFDIRELVSPKVYKKYGQASWKFLDPRLLHTVLVIRRALDRPFTVNNWHTGGKFKQRGLRSNLGYIFMSKFKKGVMYLSGHVLGRALDFTVKGMTAQEVRNWLVANQKILPYKIRLENKMKGKPISWVHLDMIWEEKNPKVYLFNV
jgi:hypothetical protein